MDGQNPPDDILIHRYAESQGDLFCNARTSPARIALFHIDNSTNQIRVWTLWSRFPSYQVRSLTVPKFPPFFPLDFYRSSHQEALPDRIVVEVLGCKSLKLTPKRSKPFGVGFVKRFDEFHQRT